MGSNFESHGYAGRMPRRARAKPRELAVAWPDGPAESVEGEVARRFAVNLRKHIGERALRAVARDCGLSHSTLIAILEGEKWVDLETIAKVEAGVGADVWPGRIAPGAPDADK